MTNPLIKGGRSSPDGAAFPSTNLLIKITESKTASIKFNRPRSFANIWLIVQLQSMTPNCDTPNCHIKKHFGKV